MAEFFRGWKRKVGVVTLVSALMLVTGWMRSGTTQDHLQIKVTDNLTYHFVSSRTSLGWQGIHWAEPEHSLRHVDMWNCATDSRMAQSEDYLHDVVVQTISRSADVPNEMTIKAWSAPYWYIVIPLALISAWLLLSKPRSGVQTPPPSRSFQRQVIARTHDLACTTIPTQIVGVELLRLSLDPTWVESV